MAVEEQLLEAWEKLIKENERTDGKFEMENYLDLSRSYIMLCNEHTIVKACLLRLAIQFNQEAMDTVQSYGYTIDTSNYFESISNCLNNSNNLITQIMVKRKELDNSTEQAKEQKILFEDLIAETSAQLKFPLSENITLAQFNAYRKTLKQRNKRVDKEIGSD